MNDMAMKTKVISIPISSGSDERGLTFRRAINEVETQLKFHIDEKKRSNFLRILPYGSDGETVNYFANIPPLSDVYSSHNNRFVVIDLDYSVPVGNLVIEARRNAVFDLSVSYVDSYDAMVSANVDYRQVENVPRSVSKSREESNSISEWSLGITNSLRNLRSSLTDFSPTLSQTDGKKNLWKFNQSTSTIASSVDDNETFSCIHPSKGKASTTPSDKSRHRNSFSNFVLEDYIDDANRNGLSRAHSDDNNEEFFGSLDGTDDRNIINTSANSSNSGMNSSTSSSHARPRTQRGSRNCNDLVFSEVDSLPNSLNDSDFSGIEQAYRKSVINSNSNTNTNSNSNSNSNSSSNSNSCSSSSSGVGLPRDLVRNLDTGEIVHVNDLDNNSLLKTISPNDLLGWSRPNTTDTSNRISKK